MTRSLKPQPMGPYRTRSGASVETFLDRNDKAFFAQVGNERVVAPSHSELLRAIDAQLAKVAKVEWLPMMEIKATQFEYNTFGRNDGARLECEAALRLRVERYYAGRRYDGVWRQLKWDRRKAEDDSLDAELRRQQESTTLTLYGSTPPQSTWEAASWTPPQMGSYGPGLPYSYPADGVTWLPYDEQLYQTLLGMIEGLHRIREQVKELVSTDTGRDLLRRMAISDAMSPLLPAPQKG